jgi:hypothetical protein
MLIWPFCPKTTFSVSEENIKNITSVMTVMGGKIVYADSEYKKYSPPELPVSPDWSPVKNFGGYYHADHHRSAHVLASAAAVTNKQVKAEGHSPGHGHPHTVLSENGTWNMHCPCYVG